MASGFLLKVYLTPFAEVSIVLPPEPVETTPVIPEAAAPITVEIPPTKIPAPPTPQPEPSPPPPKVVITSKPTKPPEEVLAEIPINLKSIVVLRCLYKDRHGNKKKVFGSGVIVSPEGLVLTVRHLVDQEYTLSVTGGQQGFSGYTLDHCDAGQPPSDSKAPTPDEIRRFNPFYIIDLLPFTAQVQFLPNTSGWSDKENELFDIALLRLTGTNKDAEYFGVTMPQSFDYSQLLREKLPPRAEEVITFGFPGGDPEYGSRFKIQGSVGQIKDLIDGNKEFANQLLEIAATMETIGGRSGSPLFWKGYVIGIISFKEDYSVNSFATSILPLLKLWPL